MIALTFDDGPSAKNTSRILDILEENGAKATFFVIGQNLINNADVVTRAYRMGCEIGNHTYDHKKICSLSTDEIQSQFEKTDDALNGILGIRPKLLRVPCGKCNASFKSDRPIILWSVDTEDWVYGCRNNGNSPENRQKIIRQVLDHAKDGDIILMHDLYSITAECCREIIPGLINMGFELVTVSELFEAKNRNLQGGEVYRNCKVIQSYNP